MNLPRMEAAQSQLDRASAALAAGLADAAWEHLRKALTICPDLPETRLLEARIQLARQRPQEAMRALDAHVHGHPEEKDSPQMKHLRAQALLAMEQYESALPLLEKMAAEFPDDTQMRRMLLMLLLKLGRSDQALGHARHLAKMLPQDQSILRLSTELEAVSDISGAAQKNLLAAVGRHRAMLLLRSARLYRWASQWREAAEIYDQLAADHPLDTMVQLEAGEFADQLGESEIAVKRLLKAVSLPGRQRSGALLTLGKTYLHMGKFEQAGRCFFRLARLDEDDTIAWAGLLISTLMAGRFKLTRRVHRHVSGRASRHERRRALADLWPHACMGQAIRQGESQAASSTTAKANGVLGEFLENAARTFETRVGDGKIRADWMYHLAICKTTMGKKEEAKAATAKALQANPQYAAAKRLAGHLDRLAKAA